MKQVCKGCPDRWVDIENGKTCHSVCSRYKALQAAKEQERVNRQKDIFYITEAAKKRRNEWKKRNVK